jgi:GxxExxY protein
VAKLGNIKMIDPRKAAKGSDALGQRIAQAAFDVHRAVGPGFAPGVYKQCLAAGLREAGMAVETDVAIPLAYKTITIDHAFTADIVVNGTAVIVVRAEPKSDDHKDQLASFLKASGKTEAYLMNFGLKDMRQGIARATVRPAQISFGAPDADKMN